MLVTYMITMIESFYGQFRSATLQINGAYEKQISQLQENLVAELQAQYAARNPLLSEIPEFWKQTLRNAFRHYLTDLDHTILDDLVQVSASVSILYYLTVLRHP